MMLSPGNYTIAASSNGFDGNASGEGIPYYMGSTTVTIPADGSSVSASIVCRLANVKVTFRFDTSVLSVFKSLAMEVVSSVSGVLPQSATCSPTERVVYFPVGDLTVRTAVTNMAGTTFPALEKPITGVKARDHYILNCKLGDFGNGGITVEAARKRNIPIPSRYLRSLPRDWAQRLRLCYGAGSPIWKEVSCLSRNLSCRIRVR